MFKNEIRKTAKISAEFCLKLGWFRLEKNGGGALNPRPLVSAPQNPFVFQQEISKPKAHLSRRPFVGKSPQSEGAGGSGISGRSAPVLAVGRAVSCCLSLGRGRGSRARPELRPQGPTARPGRSPRVPGRRGCRTPQFQRGKCILLLTDPASKNKKD